MLLLLQTTVFIDWLIGTSCYSAEAGQNYLEKKVESVRDNQKVKTRFIWFLMTFLMSLNSDSVTCPCVAACPLRVLRRREEHSAGEEVTEEKFTRHETDVSSAS